MDSDKFSSVHCNKKIINNIPGFTCHSKDMLDNILQCDHCEKTFRHQSNPESHLMIVHAGEFLCDVCDEQFLDSNQLMNHLFTHRNYTNENSGIFSQGIIEIDSDTERPTSWVFEDFSDYLKPIPARNSTSSNFKASASQIQESTRPVSFTEDYVCPNLSVVPNGNVSHSYRVQEHVCDRTPEKTQNIGDRTLEKTRKIGDRTLEMTQNIGYRTSKKTQNMCDRTSEKIVNVGDNWTSEKTQNGVMTVKYGFQKMPHRCNVCKKQFLLSKSLERHQKKEHQCSRESTRNGLKFSVRTNTHFNAPCPQKDPETINKNGEFQKEIDMQIPEQTKMYNTTGSNASSCCVPEHVIEHSYEINKGVTSRVKNLNNHQKQYENIKSEKFFGDVKFSPAHPVNENNESKEKEANSKKKEKRDCHSICSESKKKQLQEKGRNKHLLSLKHFDCYVKLYDLFDMCDLDNHLNNLGVRILNVDHIPKFKFLNFIKSYKKKAGN